MKKGKRNLITDVVGLKIGHAESRKLASGVSVALFEPDAVVAVFIPGGGAAGRDQECLALESAVERVHGLVLSGGSGFGLDAASGVQAFLRAQGRGFQIGAACVPIVPQAICFDLLNGGDKDWGRYPPYRELAYEACRAADVDFALGSVGAGLGATTADLKGGIGSASVLASSGHVVGALAVVNAISSAVVDGGPHFWAAPWEIDGEFGGLGAASHPSGALLRKGHVPATTIALVATDAALSKAQCKRLAISAAGGMSKGLRFAHAALDGDTIFAAATGAASRKVRDSIEAKTQDGGGIVPSSEQDPAFSDFSASGGPFSVDLLELGALASDCLARAIARGVFEARALPFVNAAPAWRDKFGAI